MNRNREGQNGAKPAFSDKNLFYILLAISAVVICALLAFRCGDLLLKTGERSLFLSTSLFLKDCMRFPGGLLTYIGSFASQFLSVPLAGAILITLLWGIVVILARQAFHLKSGWGLLAFIPAAALIAADMDMGYQIYAVKLSGWFFTSALGYIVTLLSFLPYRRIHQLPLRIAYVVLWTAIGYPLAGFYALLGTAAMAASSLTRQARDYICAAAAVIAIIASPLIWAGHYTTGRVSDAFLACLPLFPMNGLYLKYWIPYIILLLYTVLAAAPLKPLQITGSKRLVVQAATFASCMLLAYVFWFKDENFKAEVRMSNAIDRCDWKAVTKIHAATSERHRESDRKAFEKHDYDNIYAPSRLMVMYKDLALLKLGIAGSSAFRYSDGSRLPKCEETISSATQGGKQLYLNYGLLNCCYHWCIEDAVEFGWNAESLKFAVSSALLSGDWDIAEKYLGQLDNSPMHRKWAGEQRKYLRHPELIVKSAEYSHIIPLICKADFLDSDKASVELFLLKYFKNCRLPGSTPEFDDAALLWMLRSQDIPSFWNQFSNWISTHKGSDVPVHYQEAAYMYGNLDKSVNISGLPFSQDVVKSYNSFMKFASQHPFSSEKEASLTYNSRFGDTFYYFYYFIRNIQTY